MIGHNAAVLEAPEVTSAPSYPAVGGSTSRDFERLEAEIAARVLPLAATDDAPVRFRFRGRTIVALPLDTRRFVRAMARYVSMN